jgi:hypothetical protein
MRAIFGGIIAVVLLAIYIFTVGKGVDIANCLAAKCGTYPTIESFNDGMANAMSIINGLVSALVIAELSRTEPSQLPSGESVLGNTASSGNRFVKYATLAYLVIWLIVGLGAFIQGNLIHPKVLQPLTDLGQTWLGLAVASVYSYFGITPPKTH